MKKINIAIDGPSGSGKGTIGKLVAKELNYNYIDTGIMYRVLTYLILENEVNITDDYKIQELLNNEFNYEIKEGKIYLNNKDITDAIRTEEVNKIVSIVAGKQYVREKLVTIQKKMAMQKGIVMDGRDITTIVMPEAELKIYLTASLEDRATRRYLEYKKKGINITYEEVKVDTQKRDDNDINKNKTLKITDESIVVDSTNKSIEEVKEEILKLAKEKISND